MEMQQTARAVTFQISEETRLAGQGVPTYAASFDSSDSEGTAVILNGSDDTHLRFRAGLSNVETTVTSAPANYTANVARSVNVGDASVFSSALGTTSPTGRFAYVSGPAAGSCWGWVRAEVNSIQSATNTMTLTPRDSGDGCRTPAGVVAFVAPQKIVLEESVSIYFNAGSIWRTTASDMTNPLSPTWAPVSELGRSFASLNFAYYDEHDVPITPDTLTNRLAVARIDVKVVAQPSATLSGATWPTFGLVAHSIPANVRTR
jgi:hypothetical protein